MTWAVPPVDREQLVLFPTSLDDVIPEDHLVRVVDEILRSLDWSKFEAEAERGQKQRSRKGSGSRKGKQKWKQKGVRSL